MRARRDAAGGPDARRVRPPRDHASPTDGTPAGRIRVVGPDGHRHRPVRDRPDWGCMYVIQVEGPDGAVHEGWFDDGVIVGDVPRQLGEGAYRITFLKQRVSDVSSQVPVPGGTPRLRTGATCSPRARPRSQSRGAADIRVEVAFAEATCTTTATSTWG